MPESEPRAVLSGITPFFIVTDIDKSVGFYQDKLGFDLRFRRPRPDDFFAMVGRDHVQIMLKEISPDVSPLPNTTRHPWARWDAFVYVEEPDDYANELIRRGTRMIAESEDSEDGLRGFSVVDVDGYTLFFGKPV